MIDLGKPSRADPAPADAVFPALSRAMFGASYPEGAHKLRHNLSAHPLLELDALAELAEVLPASSVECRCVDPRRDGDCEPDAGPAAVGHAIRAIEQAQSWALLGDIGQMPAYAALVGELIDEMTPEIVAKTGRVLSPHGSIRVSSPGIVTPCRLDPEHSILLQLAGSKAMTVFPAGNAPGALELPRDARELTWRDDLAEHGMTFRLEPGEALYLPVMAPHYAHHGAIPSISLSISWSSEWSLAEADARAFNGLLRAWGFDPAPPGRWPARNRAKAIAWRMLRRLPGID